MLSQEVAKPVSIQRVKHLDIDADIYGGITNKQIFDFVKDNLEFDQLIWEFGTDNRASLGSRFNQTFR